LFKISIFTINQILRRTKLMLDFAANYQKRIEEQLSKLLTHNLLPIYQDLFAQLAYSVLGGGKRLRSFLTYATCAALNGNLERSDCAAIAVELIHSYSLIHDDLPAMDNDDLRRGKPSAHIKFGQANAILSGDALQCLAFEVLADDQKNLASTKIKMLKILASASGVQGMVAGQFFDLAATGQHINLQALENIHLHKTGALMQAAILLGAYAAVNSDNLDEQIADDLIKYSENLGLAFQVQDDILDASTNSAILGKTSGKDLVQNKATFVNLLGLKAAQEYAQNLIIEAKKALQNWDQKANNLRQLADFVIERKF